MARNKDRMSMNAQVVTQGHRVKWPPCVLGKENKHTMYVRHLGRAAISHMDNVYERTVYGLSFRFAGDTSQNDFAHSHLAA